MVQSLADLWSKVSESLNFFRIHVLFLTALRQTTFTPLIFSGVFYAANGDTHVSFVDALFNCYSAVTVCGLATVDLSSITTFQQALLFIQSAIGNTVVVSWVMVYIRRQYFDKKLQYIVETEIAKRKALTEQRREEQERQGRPILRRFTTKFTVRPSMNSSVRTMNGSEKGQDRGGLQGQDNMSRSVRSGIIRRLSIAPRRVNPNGVISEPVLEKPVPEVEPEEVAGEEPVNPDLSLAASQTPTLRNDKPADSAPGEHHHHVAFDDEIQTESENHTPRPSREGQVADGYFAPRVESPALESGYRPSADVIHDDRTYIPPGGAPVRRRTTMVSHRAASHRSIYDGASLPEAPVSQLPAAKNRGYGGFPYPTTILYHLMKEKALPGVRRSLERGVTLLPERTRTILTRVETRHSEKHQPSPMKYFSDSFNALIGRNSKFYDLTEENLEELGGVEYRALNALLWIVASYHLMTQLICFTIVAPYMSMSRWTSSFSPPNLHQNVSPVWYSAFQVMSAYTTSGMSLVDQSMVPFQRAYPLVFACTFLVFAGYLAYPILLRLYIWVIMKVFRGTRLHETLHFLLDHPRRCYIYLFPSHQTWVLLGATVLLHCMDWLFFLVLNIDIPTIEEVPVGVRFAIGLLQSTCARAGGFATVSISALAPAVQVLFILVMYMGVYPIALSIQSTNVYEEKSLGVFEDEEDEEEAEPKVEGSRSSYVGKYLAWHARRQLSFDMWWLACVLFLLCIIERGKLRNQENFGWFTIFAIIFEIISAYSGCGMSLGLPYANYSFSGSFQPLSKLILCAVMLRGRHRGLPVAIDRAVMLPFEFRKAERAAAGLPAGGESAVGDADVENNSVINRIIDENGEVRKKSR